MGKLPEAFTQVLVTEYGPGAGIGWHRDKAVFDEIIGISLGTACTLRLRREYSGKWQRLSVELAPRSAYLLSGAVRIEWEHSIPPVTDTRYSLTFRSLKAGRGEQSISCVGNIHASTHGQAID